MSRSPMISRCFPALLILSSPLIGCGCGQGASQYEVGAEATYGQQQHMKAVQDEERERFEMMKAQAKTQPKPVVGE